MPPTLVYNTTFSHGVISSSGSGLFNSIVGSPTIPSPYNYLRATYAVGGTYVSKTLLSANAVLVGRFNVYFEALATGDSHGFFQMNAATGNSLTLFFYPDGPNLIGGYNTELSFRGDSYAQVTTGQKYRIDFKIDGTGKTFDWQVDGHAQTQKTFTTAATYNGFMCGAWSGGDSQIVRISDIALSQTAGDYPLGAGAVVGLRPSDDVNTEAPGTNSLESADGTDISYASNKGYQYLDENPWTSEAALDRIQGILNTGGDSDHVDIAFADTAETTINGVRAILQYASASTSANLGACVIVDEDATITTLWGNPTTRADYSETSAFYKSVQLPTPAGGWDMAAVNALVGKLGYYTDGNPDIYWLAIMLEVDYVPATGTTYNEAPASSFSSTPVCSPGTFVAMSPSLAAFASTPALARAVAADLVGSVAMASTPALARAAVADFYNTLTWPSTPAASAIGGMDLYNVLTFASTPAATMAYFLGIFPALTLASSPALSPSAVATFYNSLTVASTPAAVMAAIGNFYKSLSLASSPALSVVGGSDYYNTLTVASGPAFSTVTFKTADGSISLASSPTFTAANLATLLAAISLASTPALARTGNLDILVSRTMSSSPALSTSGGMDLYNSILLASTPSLLRSAILTAVGNLSLASSPALVPTSQASLLANISLLSQPGISRTAALDILLAITVLSNPAFAASAPAGGGIFYKTVQENIGFRERTLESEVDLAAGGKEIIMRWIGRIWNERDKTPTTWDRTDKGA